MCKKCIFNKWCYDRFASAIVNTYMHMQQLSCRVQVTQWLTDLWWGTRLDSQRRDPAQPSFRGRGLWANEPTLGPETSAPHPHCIPCPHFLQTVLPSTGKNKINTFLTLCRPLCYLTYGKAWIVNRVKAILKNLKEVEAWNCPIPAFTIVWLLCFVQLFCVTFIIKLTVRRNSSNILFKFCHSNTSWVLNVVPPVQWLNYFDYFETTFYIGISPSHFIQNLTAYLWFLCFFGEETQSI